MVIENIMANYLLVDLDKAEEKSKFLTYFWNVVMKCAVNNLLKKIFRLNSKHYAIIENPESSKGKLPKPYFIKKEGEVCGIRRGICAEGLKCEGVVGDGPGICVRIGSGK